MCLCTAQLSKYKASIDLIQIQLEELMIVKREAPSS